MSNKSINKALIVILIIIIIMFSLFAYLIHLNKNTVDEELAFQMEKRQRISDIQNGVITGKYESSVFNNEFIFLEQEDRNDIDKLIDEVVTMINNRASDKLYDLLKLDYRVERFPTKYSLGKFIYDNFKAGDFYSTGYELDSKNLYITLNSKSTSGDTIKTIRVSNYDEEEKYIYFGDYRSMRTIRLAGSNSYVQIKSNAIFNYKNYSSLLLSITNITDKPLHIDFSGSYVLGDYARRYKQFSLYYEADVQSVDIKPKQTTTYELRFNKFSVSASKAVFLMDINGDKQAINNAYITTRRVN